MCRLTPLPASRSSRYALLPSGSSHLAPGPTEIPSEPSTFSSTAIGAPDRSRMWASTLNRLLSSRQQSSRSSRSLSPQNSAPLALFGSTRYGSQPYGLLSSRAVCPATVTSQRSLVHFSTIG